MFENKETLIFWKNYLPPIRADLFNAINITDDNASVRKRAGEKSHQSEADWTIGPVKQQIRRQAKRMGQHQTAFAAENVRNAAETESADEQAEHEDRSRN